MTHEDIVKRLREIMQSATREAVDWDSVTEATAIGALGFDSLSILDLMYDVQQALGIEFDAVELVHLKTVGDLVSFLEARVAAA